MARWLGIDHGAKRLGVAAGSTEDGFASPLAVVPASPLAQAIRRILDLAAQYDAEGIVVGWPINMDDTEGPQAILARKMAVELSQATQLDVRLWDERLSSFTADQALAGHMTRLKRRRRQDAVAAAAMLQDFLARGGPQSAVHPEDV